MIKVLFKPLSYLILGKNSCHYINIYNNKIYQKIIHSLDDLKNLIAQTKITNISIAIDYDCINYNNKLLPKLNTLEMKYTLKNIVKFDKNNILCAGTLNLHKKGNHTIYEIECNDRLYTWIQALYKQDCYVNDIFPIAILQQHIFPQNHNVYSVSKSIDGDIRHVFIRKGLIEFSRYTANNNIKNFINTTERYIQSNYGIGSDDIKKITSFEIYLDNHNQIMKINDQVITKQLKYKLLDIENSDKFNSLITIKNKYKYSSFINLQQINLHIVKNNVVANRYLNLVNQILLIIFIIQMSYILYSGNLNNFLHSIIGLI